MIKKIIFIGLLIIGSSEYCWAENNIKINPLIAKIQKIAEHSHCIVGVTAVHIEKNKKISYNGNQPFFMASTVKIPIALTLLERIDRKKDRLQRLIKFKVDDAVPGSGNLYGELKQHPYPHVLSLQKLLSLMLQISDNTATDLILKEIDGPSTVTHQLRALGFNRIFVNRSIYDLYLSSSGLPYYSAHFNRIEYLNKALCSVNPAKKVCAWKHFQNDKRDTTTPNEMALLLARLYQNKILSQNSTHFLLGIMSQCQTGANRIKGLLPPCVLVAHKTGTWTENFSNYPGYRQLYRYANDVGIITLPAHKGHIAIAVFVKSKGSANSERERVIARISREIYDYFLRQ